MTKRGVGKSFITAALCMVTMALGIHHIGSFVTYSLTNVSFSPTHIRAEKEQSVALNHFRSRTYSTMAHNLYTDETPADVKNAKGLHLVTQNTPNGQAVQIFLEELKDVYGTEWTTTVIDISTNEQKKDWFLRLDPNGKKIDVLFINYHTTD